AMPPAVRAPPGGSAGSWALPSTAPRPTTAPSGSTSPSSASRCTPDAAHPPISHKSGECDYHDLQYKCYLSHCSPLVIPGRQTGLTTEEKRTAMASVREDNRGSLQPPRTDPKLFAEMYTSIDAGVYITDDQER